MNTHRSASRTPRRAGAFTLLEVIIAITILGLGVLGLAAVFAGSARQQVDSSRTGEALNLASSFEQTVRSRFGPIAVGGAFGVDPQGPFGVPAQYSQLNVPLPPGEWFAVSAYPDQPNRPVDALAIDPNATPNNSALNVFFLVDGPRDTVLFHNPLNPRNGLPRYGGTQALGTVVNAATYDFESAQAPFFDGAAPLIRDLPHGRIQPGSLRIRFDIAQRERNPFDVSQWRVASRRSVYFSDAAFSGDANTIDNPGGFLEGDFGNTEFPRADDGKLRVLFNRTLIPDDPPTAFIARFQPAVGVNNYLSNTANNEEWIERIVVESYQWRNDALASVGDRVRRRPDGSVLAVAPLLQRTESGAWRMAMFVYHARATREDPDNVYVPPESGAPANRVLRAFDVNLNYDSASERWYFLLNTAEQRRYLAPGRIALVNDDALGADEFVQIARVERRGANDRAYLDRPPRAGGEAIVPPNVGAQRNVRVWCLNDNVGSLEGNSDWVISPVIGRVVSLR